MLTEARIEHILDRLPQRTIGVLGDLFLDRYLDVDSSLTEKSIETGLDAYQVTRVRSLPGALGTIINNLVALGVGRIVPVSVIGDDGEGYELRQALATMKTVDPRWVCATPLRRTPTYTKPMLHEAGPAPRELNRLDIKNRTPLPGPLQDWVIEALHEAWRQVDALIVLDQVSEEDCGVVTARVREQLAQLADRDPDRFVLADSRERIGLFRSVCVKPNLRECCEAAFPELRGANYTPGVGSDVQLPSAAQFGLRLKTGRAVFCTSGEHGISLVGQCLSPDSIQHVPAYPVAGPIDIVGAGDSTSAGITCAVAAGTSLEEAAAFGCLVASITVQQIGTTGSASPEQVRQRWRQVCRETKNT